MSESHADIVFECPLEGSDSENAVTHRQLNGLIRRVGFYHLVPMRKKLDDTATQLEMHMRDCGDRQIEIMAYLRVIKWLLVLCVPLLATAGYDSVVKYLQIMIK